MERSSRIALYVAVALVAVVAAVAVFGRKARWARPLQSADLPGGVAAVLGLFMAIGADYVAYFKWSLATLAGGLCVWWFIIYFVDHNRRDRRTLMRLAQRAFSLSGQVFNLLSDFRNRSQVVGFFPDPLSQMREEYMRNPMRYDIPDFLEELSADGVRYDERLLDLALGMGSVTDISAQSIEDLASGLWRISDDLRCDVQGKKRLDWQETV